MDTNPNGTSVPEVVAVFDKAALFAALKPKSKTVEVDDFGSIVITGITARAAAAAQKQAQEAGSEYWPYLVILCAFDQSGNKIFDESDIDNLLNSGNGQIESLVSATLVVNGYKKEPNEKNLPATPVAASSSV